MKIKIRLTESDLHNIVKESVKKILRETKGFDTVNEDNSLPINQFHPDWFYYQREQEGPYPEDDMEWFHSDDEDLSQNFEDAHERLHKKHHGKLSPQEIERMAEREVYGESKIGRAIRESVNRVLNEGYGYVSNDGNPMVGGYWWSQEEEGTRYLSPSDLAYVLNENGFISEEERDEFADYLEQTVNDDDFVVRASCESGWDSSTNHGGCEIGLDDDDIDRIIQIVMNMNHPHI